MCVCVCVCANDRFFWQWCGCLVFFVDCFVSFIRFCTQMVQIKHQSTQNTFCFVHIFVQFDRICDHLACLFVFLSLFIFVNCCCYFVVFFVCLTLFSSTLCAISDDGVFLFVRFFLAIRSNDPSNLFWSMMIIMHTRLIVAARAAIQHFFFRFILYIHKI